MDKHSYSYQEIFLKPRYSDVKHRSEYGTLVTLGGRVFRLPVIPANMKCVIDLERARWLSEEGYFYIMHRFGRKTSITSEAIDADNKEFINTANKEGWRVVSMSVGVNDRDKEFVLWCKNSHQRIDFITIDIAHGHSLLMKEMIAHCKQHFPLATVIAGNVATPEAVRDLTTWGADVVKVGIAQGGACTTFGKTGFGTPMFSCVQRCVEYGGGVKHTGRPIPARIPIPAKVPIIADGGIKTNGDIAKAIVAGATFVMAGSLFAACKDSPAETVEGWVGYPRKKYYGSASEYNTHNTHHIEGTLVELRIDRWNYAEKLLEVKEDLQSSISYGGGDLTKVGWGIRTD